MKLKIDNTYCPVCGYDWEKQVFSYENDRLYFSAEVTGEICPSCGREFDYNLFPNEKSYLENRLEWMKKGMMYGSESLREKYPGHFTVPENWNPVKQLKNIEINLQDPRVLEEYSTQIPEIKTVVESYTKR